MKQMMIGLGLTAVVLVLTTLAVRASEPAKTEIDGTWELVKFNDKGEDDQETVKLKFIVIREKGTQTIMKGGKLWKTAQYAVRPNATPKEITWRGQKDGKKSLLGIYDINGDTMKIAIHADEAKRSTERPKDFTPSENKKIATYRRKEQP